MRGFRLERSGLLSRWKDRVDATRRLCGMHAQVMSCAELALAARVAGLRVEEVREALRERPRGGAPSLASPGRHSPRCATRSSRFPSRGRRAWASAGDADALRKAAPSGPARLLPGFDPYVVGFQPCEGLMEPKWKARVSRTAGWISPVVLVEGRAVGVWEHKLRRGVMEIRVEPFRRLAAARRRELEADAERLGGALGAPASVTIAR